MWDYDIEDWFRILGGIKGIVWWENAVEDGSRNHKWKYNEVSAEKDKQPFSSFTGQDSLASLMY